MMVYPISSNPCRQDTRTHVVDAHLGTWGLTLDEEEVIHEFLDDEDTRAAAKWTI